MDCYNSSFNVWKKWKRKCTITKKTVFNFRWWRGLILEEDRRNLHVLKLTTQRDPYKRKLIKNWKQLGLRRKSYIRIELPIKIEKEQLSHKIATLPVKQLLEMCSEVYNLINTQALEKMAKKYKEITKT